MLLVNKKVIFVLDKKKTAKGACVKYVHANKKRYSSTVHATVQHVILHNQIKEIIVIISNWKGTFIKCKTCKRILTGKKRMVW